MNKLPLILTKVFASNGECVDSPIFICPEGAEYEVVEVAERHLVAGTNGGAVTLMLTKAADGVSVVGATALFGAGFDMKSTINTMVRKTVGNGGLVSALATRTLRGGQALGLDFTGTLTALAGMVVVVSLVERRPSLRH